MTMPIPISSTSSPAGAKSFSPTNAACCATVTISRGSFVLSARSPRMVKVRPPPTQKTASVTCTHLKSEYQLSIAKPDSKTNSSPIATMARPSATVSSPDRRASAGAAEEVDSMAVGLIHPPDGFKDLVEIRKLGGLVPPGAANDPVGADDEGRASRHVLQAAVLVRDAEAVRRLAVPVGEQGKVEVERLHPGDVGPGRVARDAVRLDARVPELRAPVTQGLHLVRSGRGPVEEVEEEEDRPFGCDLDEAGGLVRRRPDLRVGDALADPDHAATTAASVRSAMSRTTSTTSRFALKVRSWRSAELPRTTISSTRLSSDSAPSSRACGAITFSVRRIECETGARFRLPVWRSITGASSP